MTGQQHALRADTMVMPRSNPAASVHRTTGRLLRQISGAISVFAFSPTEEEFFRTGDAMAEPTGDFRDLDDGYQRPTLWRAMLGWLRGNRTEYAE
jgi:hypothetical protein